VKGRGGGEERTDETGEVICKGIRANLELSGEPYLNSNERKKDRGLTSSVLDKGRRLRCNAVRHRMFPTAQRESQRRRYTVGDGCHKLDVRENESVRARLGRVGAARSSRESFNRKSSAEIPLGRRNS